MIMSEDFEKEFGEVRQSLAIIRICQDLLEHKKRDTKLLFIALIISLCINLVIVGAFLWYESNWEYTDTTTIQTEQTVDGDGSIINGDQYNDQSQNNTGGED